MIKRYSINFERRLLQAKHNCEKITLDLTKFKCLKFDRQVPPCRDFRFQNLGFANDRYNDPKKAKINDS